MRSFCFHGFILAVSVFIGLDVGLAISKEELESRKSQLEAQLKLALESYAMAKKIYEESLRTKDSVDLRRSQFFEAKERVKRLHGELRAWGIKSEYVVLDDKVKKLMKDSNKPVDVPRGTGR